MPHPQSFGFTKSGEGLRVYISCKFPGNVDAADATYAAGSGATFWEAQL